MSKGTLGWLLVKISPMAHFNINLRDNKTPNLDTPLVLIVRWDNKKLKYPTLEKVPPIHFELCKSKKAFQRIKSSYIGFSEFNVRLDHIESMAQLAFRQLVNDNGGKSPNPTELKQLIDIKLGRSTKKEKPDFFQFAEAFIRESELSRVNTNGKRISSGTVRIYRNTIKRLRQYEKIYKRKVDFDTITFDFYDEFVQFLSQELQLSVNTTGRYIKTLRVLLNAACDKNLNQNYCFRNKRFRVLTEVTNKIYLNEKELDEMFNLDLSNNKKLERVRDLFLFACYTGLRYSDAVNIKKENIVDDMIKIKMQKTGDVIIIPVHWKIKRIMERYISQPNNLPPSLSNQKFNSYIKLVAALVPSLQQNVELSITRAGNLETKCHPKYLAVSCHTARRSFISNLYKSGLNSHLIAKMSGHKSLKVFEGYIKVTLEENALLLKDHWNKMDDLNYSNN